VPPDLFKLPAHAAARAAAAWFMPATAFRRKSVALCALLA
jgi:hypothetical protein